MCGICGIFNFNRQAQVDRALLEGMNRQIVHRGPDDEGFYLHENVGLAMRRLSIIDLKTGQQPISNEDGTIWIVYNGEIYNHVKLRAELRARGHSYRTQSDTETIVHLYEEYGADCVQHLRGMFAFALWDGRRRILFAARDRLGIKPFYYWHSPNQFLFGSEIKTLLAFPDVASKFNRDGLPEYLAFGYLAGPETLFSGIQKLLPGHSLEISEAGQLTTREYWDLPQSVDEQPQPESFYVQTYRSLLEDAVASHLMSDVPLGVFLSGGIDSSVIAALMSKIRGREPIQTFSVGYDEEAYSELNFARTVSNHIGSEHHEVRVSRQDFFDALPKLIWHEDEPIVWPSSISLYFVAKLSKKRVTVVLTGEGSDETLAGYIRYPMALWNARLNRIYQALTPSFVSRWVREDLLEAGFLGARLRSKLKHTFLGRVPDSWTSTYFDNFYSAFSEVEQQPLLHEDLRFASNSAYRAEMAYWERSRGDLISRLLYTDIKTYLVELCMKQDQMSMAASVESRVPFLDHVLVEFAARIPSSLKTSGLTGKMILKKAVQDLLPHSILYRQKMGFPTPLSSWLVGAQLNEIERLLLEPRSLDRGLFQRRGLQNLFAEHRAGRRDHSDRFWRLLNLEIWQRVFLDGKVLGEPAMAVDLRLGENRCSPIESTAGFEHR